MITHAAAYEPQELAAGLWLVPVEIPVPLRTVNAYLLFGGEGWTIVDTGHHTPTAEARWERSLRRLGVRFDAVCQIVVTHYHPDHLGCAGWLQQRSGAPVFVLDREMPNVERFWGMRTTMGEALEEQFTRHGAPPSVTAGLASHHRQQAAMVHPLPTITPVAAGSEIRAGRRRFVLHHAPGHSEGLMVLYEPDERILLANDLILDPITPNVTLWPHSQANPLDEFLDSLRRAACLGARLTLPGHGRPIADLARRVDELQAHHEARLARIEAMVARGGHATAWEVSLELFGPQRELIAARFALGEALSHLEWLVQRGRLARTSGSPVVRYHAPTAGAAR